MKLSTQSQGRVHRADPPAGRSVAVRIEGVTKRYATRDGEVLALDTCTLDFAPGEFISVVGPSGCGKSTLMLMLAGLVPSSSGTIRIDDHVVTEPYTDLGIVFQDAVLLDWRRVLDNVMLQAQIRRLDQAAMRARALELISLVGLEGFEKRYPYELSGGMRQRVSICRGLVHDPPLLLMDEPFGAIDALTRDQLNLDLQNLWMRSPKTVLFVTHSIDEAVFLADRVVVMSPRPGRVVEVIDVDLERPRRLTVRDTPEFGAISRHIRELFEHEGVLHDDGQR
jgi:NitT/TauT family transport system ATP-binding protein